LSMNAQIAANHQPAHKKKIVIVQNTPMIG
jgi:hypothetical protein